MWFLVWGGCGSDEPTSSTLAEVEEASLVVLTRDEADLPIDGIRIWWGTASGAQPDLAGVAMFRDIIPGHVPVHVRDQGARSRPEAGVDVERATAAAIWLGPVDTVAVAFDDLGLPGVAQAGSATLTWDALVSFDGDPAIGPGEIQTASGFGTRMRRIPGSALALHLDDVFVPWTLLDAVYLSPPVDGAGDDFLPSPSARLRWEGPVPDDALLYRYDPTDAYWRQVDKPDLVDGGLETDVNHFGWFALGRPGAPDGCVTGELWGPDGPVVGAELTATVAGGPGLDRVASDADGHFCITVPAGVAATVDVFGAQAGGANLFVAHEVVTASLGSCEAPAACTDLGRVEPAVHSDADQDGYASQLGDCDDFDPAVNPSLTYGDGSYCTDPS